MYGHILRKDDEDDWVKKCTTSEVEGVKEEKCENLEGGSREGHARAGTKAG